MNSSVRSLLGAASLRTRVLLLAAVLASASHAIAAGPAELYGKPLRGLSPVRLADVLASPERYAGKTIRVLGAGAKASAAGPASSAAAVTITEGSAALRIETDGTFALPEKLEGAQVTAEGKVGTVRKDSSDPGPTFVAIGVEVKR